MLAASLASFIPPQRLNRQLCHLQQVGRMQVIFNVRSFSTTLSILLNFIQSDMKLLWSLAIVGFHKNLLQKSACSPKILGARVRNAQNC